MKLGVITDGLSRDPQVAFPLISQAGLQYAELQYVWDREIGDLDASQTKQLKELLAEHELQVPIITRHVFGGVALKDLTTSSAEYQSHFEGLKRCFAAAHELGAPLVRTMSFRKEMILFGDHGADQWNVAKGVWEQVLELFAPVIELAQAEGIPVAVETGNNAIVNSVAMGQRLIKELNTIWMKILWDPANALFANERPFPDAYEKLTADDLLVHLHIKDVNVSIQDARISCAAMGSGQMQPYLQDMAAAMKQAGYEGVVSLESVYRPDGGDFQDGFAASLPLFKKLFG